MSTCVLAELCFDVWMHVLLLFKGDDHVSNRHCALPGTHINEVQLIEVEVCIIEMTGDCLVVVNRVWTGMSQFDASSRVFNFETEGHEVIGVASDVERVGSPGITLISREHAVLYRMAEIQVRCVFVVALFAVNIILRFLGDITYQTARIRILTIDPFIGKCQHHVSVHSLPIDIGCFLVF